MDWLDGKRKELTDNSKKHKWKIENLKNCNENLNEEIIARWKRWDHRRNKCRGNEVELWKEMERREMKKCLGEDKDMIADSLNNNSYKLRNKIP